MERKYYLIDTENVGDRWIDRIDHLKEDEILVVFYTNYHSRLLEETYLKQRYNKQICWVECMAGSNALDYQLIGVLSYLIATHSDASYAICSNDKDYKDAINFCKERNINITRVGFSDDKKNGSKNIRKSSKVKKAIEKPQKPLPTANNKPINVPDMDKLSGIQKLVELAKTIPTSNMGVWYTALVTLLGQEAGKNYYAQLKENEHLKAKLSRCLIPNASKRNIYLIALLYRQNHLDTAKAEDAYRIVVSHSRKNMQAIKIDFDKHFGNKTTEQIKFYRVIKPIIALLKANK